MDIKRSSNNYSVYLDVHIHTHSVIQTGCSFAKKYLRLTNIRLKPIINMNVKFIDNEKKEKKGKSRCFIQI